MLFDSINSKYTSVPSLNVHRNPPSSEMQLRRRRITSLDRHSALDLSVSDTAASLITSSGNAFRNHGAFAYASAFS